MYAVYVSEDGEVYAVYVSEDGEVYAVYVSDQPRPRCISFLDAEHHLYTSLNPSLFML